MLTSSLTTDSGEEGTKKKRGLGSDELPIRRMFEVLVGMAHIQPSEFWNMSWQETTTAMEGFMEFHVPNQQQPLSRDELTELMELYPD